MSNTTTYRDLKSRSDKQGYYASGLFLVWPFLATISALKNYREPWAKNIFWAFCAFYGFTFAIGSESSGHDIVRYIADYQSLYRVEISFQEIINTYLNSDEIDILRTVISVVLSRFTDNPAVLTLVYGLIFGYFLSRNLWFLLERLEGKIAPITLMLLVCFFLVNPIWEINGFRMWTAVHVFLFGLFPYLFDGKKKLLWVSVLSIFVHFSFVVPVGVMFGYIVLGNRLNFYFGIFIFSAFFAELDLDVFNRFMENYAPEILQERTSSYRSEAVVEAREARALEETPNWYVVWHGKALSWSILGFLIILFTVGRDFFREHKGWGSLFSFTLLFYSVANVLSSLPSGGRFMVIAHLCALALIVLYVQNRPKEKMLNRFVFIATPALLLFIIVAVRVGLYSMSATLLLGNPILALFLTGENLSLNDVMRMIL